VISESPHGVCNGLLLLVLCSLRERLLVATFAGEKIE
jgi:hypothetical protein